jgi:hypothetical protein
MSNATGHLPAVKARPLALALASALLLAGCSVVPGSALRGNGMIFRASVDIKASHGYWPFEDGRLPRSKRIPFPPKRKITEGGSQNSRCSVVTEFQNTTCSAKVFLPLGAWQSLC